jgi:tetratricopeptide (TPR) repeat protein
MQLAKNPESVLPESQALIAEVRAYAEASGDGKVLVTTLCALSRGIRRRDPVRGSEWAQEAKEWSPGDPRSWTHWIKALEIASEIPMALSVAWEALERFPENAYVSTELIHLLMISGRLQEGRQLALDAVERFPDDPHPYALLSAILERLEKHSEAEAVLRKAIERFGSNPRWWVDLARVLVLQGKFNDAEVALQRATEEFPAEVILWNFWGAVLARLNRLPRSEEVLRTSATRFQHHVTKISLAGTLRRQGVHRLDEALLVIDEVLKGRSGDVYALAEKAKILEDMGRFNQAASMMEELRRRDPRFVGDEPDVLADFLAADFAWQQTDEMEPAVVDKEESSFITPTSEALLKATPAVLETPGGNEDSAPVAKHSAGKLAERADESDSEQTPSGSDLAVLPPSNSTRDLNRGATHLAVPESQNTGWAPSPSGTKHDHWELAVRVSEARLLRKWARRNELANESPTPGELRQKSNRLLEGVLSRVPNHPRACLEKANLLIESGTLQEARRFLEDRIGLMPSALGLRQALARVNRESAREQKMKFDHERYATLTKPLLELQQRHPAFQPLSYLGRGRICLAMRDGQALRKTAARDFGHLRKYTSEKPQREGEFHAWWSEQIQNLLFSKLDPQMPLTADNFASVERGLEESGNRVDILEEDFAIRMSR